MEKNSDTDRKPDLIETENASERLSDYAIVSMSQEDFDNLDSLGPDNKIVQKWLADHGVRQGDRFVVRIEGVPDAVVDANPEDFLTRDREATRAWNEAQSTEVQAVDAARTLIAIEDGVDAHSAEIASEASEFEPTHITEEAIRDLGEEGLEAAEIASPEEQADADSDEKQNSERSTYVQNTYEQNILNIRFEAAQGVAQFVARLEESETELADADRTMIEAAGHSLSRLNSVIRNLEDYPTRAIQTEIRQSIDELKKLYSTTQNFGERTLSDIRRGVSALEQTLLQHTEEADGRDADFNAIVEQEGLEIDDSVRSGKSIVGEAKTVVTGAQELGLHLDALDNAIEEVSRRELRTQIARLEDLLHNSYSRPIDADELADVTRSIQKSFEDGRLQTTLSGADARLKAYIDQARQALIILNPRS